MKKYNCLRVLVLFILINLINITTIEASSLNNPIKLDSARIANTNVFISSLKSHCFESIEGKVDGKQKTTTFTYDIEIPVVKGIADADFLKKLNEKFYIEYNDAKLACEDSYEEQLNEVKKDPTTPLDDEEYDVWYLVRASYPDLISIDQRHSYSTDVFKIPDRKTINIDLKNNKILELEDFFNQKKDYKTKLLSIMTKQALDSNLHLFSFAVTELPAPDNCYISDGKLYIYYPPYSIAPPARGFIVFDIPLSDLVGYIKNRFLEY